MDGGSRSYFLLEVVMSNKLKYTRNSMVTYNARRKELYAVNHAVKKFECPACPLAFATDELYKEHYKNAHAQKRPKPNVATGANVISTA